MPILTRRRSLWFAGRGRLGLWLHRAEQPSSGISRGPDFAEVYVRGVGLGVCW